METQNKIAEYKLNVIRKIGEWCTGLEKQERKRTDLSATHDGEQTKTEALEEAGIKHYEAIANISENVYREYIKRFKVSNLTCP